MLFVTIILLGGWRRLRRAAMVDHEQDESRLKDA